LTCSSSASAPSNTHRPENRAMSPVSHIDFAALTLLEALDLAILIEDEARERYLEFAEQLETHHTEESAQFFSFMASNEEKHHRELAARRKALFGDAPVTVSRSQIFDIEAPELSEVAVFMSPRDALLVAQRAETKAYAFFASAVIHVDNAEVKALFSELAQEEIEHQALVQAELDKLPADDGFAASDFADGPVEQD